MTPIYRRLRIFYILAAGVLLPGFAGAEIFDSPQAAVGERLFREPRFAQFFAIQSGGDANYIQTYGDPLLDLTLTTGNPLPGGFSGQTISCRVCHMVDEQQNSLGNRTYAEYSRRSLLPARGDGRTFTARNSPTLVNSALGRPGGLLFHLDGEFVNLRDLSIATLTGRNYGWLPGERAQAQAHVLHILKNDDGQSFLGSEFGGEYDTLLKGVSPLIPEQFRLPKSFRIDIHKATDAQIMTMVGRLIEAYLNTLTLATDETRSFIGSPYDVFLKKNRLPRRPAVGESPAAYAKRLTAALKRLATPAFVTSDDGAFETHQQAFQFGPLELQGLKFFLNGPGERPATPAMVAAGGAANCATCHAPPLFTDFNFHNTGATQAEYDGIHGDGTFMALSIPSLAVRRTNSDQWLPPSVKRPNAPGNFAAAPAASIPALADLGLWNIFANPDIPRPQARLLLAVSKGKPATQATLLPRTIAAFKTPGLRDLSHSDPYLHHGQATTLEDVLNFYMRFAALAREGKVRNPAPALAGIAILPADIAALAAFLRSLNEDYT